MTRVFSGIKPTGHLTLGNYLGAMRRWAAVDQHQSDALFCIVDLHALTVDHDPARVRRLSRQAATLLLASGLDPRLCTVFVQSHVDEHTRLSYLLECVATDGEMRRMIQYKEKAARERVRGGSVRLSLLTYPVLMAADILAYGTDQVPVGDDQTQHVELARDIAVRFNQRYGHTFVVPRATNPAVAARVMNLQAPGSKMGKSDDTGPGRGTGSWARILAMWRGCCGMVRSVRGRWPGRPWMPPIGRSDCCRRSRRGMPVSVPLSPISE